MLGRYLIVILVIAGALVTAVAHKSSAPMSWPENDKPSPLKFSHAFHITEVSVACGDCHAAKESRLASDYLKAGHDNCTSCHEEQINNNCAYCHVDPDNIVPSEAPVREIVFSHQQHVSMDSVSCETCHPGLDKVASAGSANMPTMETCNTCHNSVRATAACEACHLKPTDLIPSDHLVANFKREHKKPTRIGALDVECSTCHTQDFCADCHAASASVRFGMGPLVADPSPRSAVTDMPDKMMLQTVHDMNYRYTHGMDAKSIAADCYSCHNYQQFCVTCHMEGEKLAGPGYVPTWHLGSGFALVGRGSGGGRHAEFARRDLESCITCHDVLGADATCMQCHVDPDGIKGTDPRTHPSGFRNGGEEGEWHTDPGATCYACHTDLNAHPGGTPGRGFCGYCHGLEN